jgi:hypothetical protein
MQTSSANSSSVVFTIRGALSDRCRRCRAQTTSRTAGPETAALRRDGDQIADVDRKLRVVHVEAEVFSSRGDTMCWYSTSPYRLPVSRRSVKVGAPAPGFCRRRRA